MENEKKIIEIDEKIAEIDRKLEELNARAIESKSPIGMISLVYGYVYLELFIDVSMFDEEKMNKLQDIANQLQELLLEIQKGVEE